jgi:hypothetical protein
MTTNSKHKRKPLTQKRSPLLERVGKELNQAKKWYRYVKRHPEVLESREPHHD